MFVRSLALVAALMSLAFDAKDDAVKEDLKKLEGTWIVVAREERGVESPKEVLDKIEMRFTFTGTKVTLKISKQIEKSEDGPFTIDSTKKPKQIDMKTGKIEVRGIFSLEGDTLKLCLVMDKDAKRPTDFTTAKDNGHGLLVLKREKK